MAAAEAGLEGVLMEDGFEDAPFGLGLSLMYFPLPGAPEAALWWPLWPLAALW